MTKREMDPAENRVRGLQRRAEDGGISVKTLRREIAAGNLEVVRLGPGRRLIGITDAAWQAYLGSRTS